MPRSYGQHWEEIQERSCVGQHLQNILSYLGVGCVSTTCVIVPPKRQITDFAFIIVKGFLMQLRFIDCDQEYLGKKDTP